MANGLDKLNDSLQTAINTLYLARGKGKHRLKTLLNGTWLGHPLHPVITDIAIGGIVLTAVFDIVWLAVPATVIWAPRAAEVTLAAGLLGMLGSIVTGLADWADTYHAERDVGLLHGAIQIIGFLVFIGSGVLRLQTPDGHSVPGAIVGFVALAFITLGSYFGGDLVFKFGTNVNHTAFEQGGDDYEAVMPLAQLPDKTLTKVTVAGVPVLLVRLGDKISAITATCTHAGGPLDEGELIGDDVKCPWHGSRFRLSDGKVTDGPATVRAPRYLVRITNGQIELKRA